MAKKCHHQNFGNPRTFVFGREVRRKESNVGEKDIRSTLYSVWRNNNNKKNGLRVFQR